MDSNKSRRRGVTNIKVNKLRSIAKKNNKAILYTEDTIFPINANDYSTEINLRVMEGNEIKNRNFKCKRYTRKPYYAFTLTALEKYGNLSKKGKILFKFIIENLVPGANAFELKAESIRLVIDEKHISNTYKVIHELVKANLIAKAPNSKIRSMYTINHNEYFKGNYEQFVNNYFHLFGEPKEEELTLNVKSCDSNDDCDFAIVECEDEDGNIFYN